VLEGGAAEEVARVVQRHEQHDQPAQLVNGRQALGWGGAGLIGWRSQGPGASAQRRSGVR